MKTGMLWFDDEKKRPFADKVKLACAHYLQKYGKVANMCYIHTGAEVEPVEGVEFKTLPTIALNHFWIGIKGE